MSKQTKNHLGQNAHINVSMGMDPSLLMPPIFTDQELAEATRDCFFEMLERIELNIKKLIDENVSRLRDLRANKKAMVRSRNHTQQELRLMDLRIQDRRRMIRELNKLIGQ